MNGPKIILLAFITFLFLCLGGFVSYAQCTATIADGNGSFTDNQIGWSSNSHAIAVQATPPPEGPSTDGGAYLRLQTTGNNAEVNIAMGGLTNGGLYIVDWEAIHGLSSTSANYPDSATYTLNILDGGNTILSQDYIIDDPTAWVPQTILFTASASDLIFQIALTASNFTSGTYRMGVDGMTITCNGTTRPCDLVLPSFQRKL